MNDIQVIDVYPYRLNEGRTEFLLLHRAPEVYCAGQWRMVGGKVERDETAWQAGLRELFEETGCRPVRFWSVPSLNHFYDPSRNRIMLIPVFAAELAPDAAVKLNEEHDQWCWVEGNRANQQPVWPEQQRLITLIRRILTSDNIPDEWIIG